MADVLNLSGSLTTQPTTGNPSGSTAIGSPIDETVGLVDKLATTIQLTFDAVQAINLGTMSGVSVIQLRATGGHVKARLTSADGAVQAVPVDPYFCLITRGVPVTAIDLQRDAGVLTSVEVFLGQKA